MENQDDRIKSLENRVEALSKDLVLYYNQIIALKNEVKSLKIGESPAATIQTENQPLPPRPKPKPTFESSRTIDNEEFLGGNLLSKVGIVILVIGIGIFVKYAIDNNLLNPAARIVLGYISGLGLGILAYFTKTKFHTYSSVLVSGAMAVFYFTTYSAYHFYHFYPLWLTFGLMIVFTVLTVYLAILYERQWIGVFGLVGAYAIPFLLSDNSGQVWKLFTYMTIVNVGVLWLMIRRNWFWMGGIAFWFTWLIFLFARNTDFTVSKNIYINISFSTIFFLLPLIYTLSKINKKQTIEIIELMFLILSSILYYTVNITMGSDIGAWIYERIFSFAFALFNAVLAYYLFKKDTSIMLFLGFIVTSALISLYLAGFFQIMSWYDVSQAKNINYEIHDAYKNINVINYTMAFLSALIYVLLRFKIKHDVFFFLIFLSSTMVLAAIFTDSATTLRMHFMESKLSSSALLIRYIQYAFIGVSILYNLKLTKTLSDSFNFLKDTRYLLLSVVILIILSYETTTIWMLFDKSKAALQSENSTRVGYSVLWALYGLAMIIIGFYKRSKQFRIAGIVLLGIVILKLFIYDLTNASTISKIILFISVGILLLIASFLYQKLSKQLLDDGEV
jgi:uncharacterized membrane protein